MDILEKSIIFNLIKNSVDFYEWSKEDIINNLSLLEKEVNNREEIKLKKEILKLKKRFEKDNDFFLKSIINMIKEGNLNIIKLIKKGYVAIEKEKDFVKLKSFKYKIKQLEKSILAELILDSKNQNLIEVSDRMGSMGWLRN